MCLICHQSLLKCQAERGSYFLHISWTFFCSCWNVVLSRLLILILITCRQRMFRRICWRIVVWLTFNRWFRSEHDQARLKGYSIRWYSSRYKVIGPSCTNYLVHSSELVQEVFVGLRQRQAGRDILPWRGPGTVIFQTFSFSLFIFLKA